MSLTKEENIWNIKSLYDLQYFNCPSCPYKNSLKQDFVNHAYVFHPESNKYLRNIPETHPNTLKKLEFIYFFTP